MSEDEEVDVQKLVDTWYARFPSEPWIVGTGQTELDAVTDLANQVESK